MNANLSTTPISEMLEFANYVMSFYGKEGVYPFNCPKEVVIDTVSNYYIEHHDTDYWGGGDSLDRERVRYLLEENGWREI